MGNSTGNYRTVYRCWHYRSWPQALSSCGVNGPVPTVAKSCVLGPPATQRDCSPLAYATVPTLLKRPVECAAQQRVQVLFTAVGRYRVGVHQDRVYQQLGAESRVDRQSAALQERPRLQGEAELHPAGLRWPDGGWSHPACQYACNAGGHWCAQKPRQLYYSGGSGQSGRLSRGDGGWWPPGSLITTGLLCAWERRRGLRDGSGTMYIICSFVILSSNIVRIFTRTTQPMTS